MQNMKKNHELTCFYDKIQRKIKSGKGLTAKIKEIMVLEHFVRNTIKSKVFLGQRRVGGRSATVGHAQAMRAYARGHVPRAGRRGPNSWLVFLASRVTTQKPLEIIGNH